MILEKSELKLENLLSIREKFLQKDLEIKMREIKEFCEKNFLIVSSITTITFEIMQNENNQQMIDIEILIEIPNQNIPKDLPEGFNYKKQVYIVNSLKNHYEGASQNSINAYNEINKYILEKKLLPITPAYAVSNNPYAQPDNFINLDIYVGLNPNIM